jgi:hypothetical protein
MIRSERMGTGRKWIYLCEIVCAAESVKIVALFAAIKQSWPQVLVTIL